MKKQKSKQKSLWILSIMLLSCLLFWGCKEFNDNPADSETISINIQDLQKQVPIAQSSPNGSVSAQSSQSPPSGVYGLLLGTVIVTSRSTAYETDVSYDSDELDNFREELMDSVNYIRYVSLPTSKNYVEFSVPPKSAGNWQIFAVGLDFKLNTFSDLAESEHENSMIYMGFIEQFYTWDDVTDSKLIGQTLIMKHQ